jgi:hypothetical protein
MLALDAPLTTKFVRTPCAHVFAAVRTSLVRSARPGRELIGFQLVAFDRACPQLAGMLLAAASACSAASVMEARSTSKKRHSSGRVSSRLSSGSGSRLGRQPAPARVGRHVAYGIGALGLAAGIAAVTLSIVADEQAWAAAYQVRVAKLERRIAMLSAILPLVLTLLRFSGFELERPRVPDPVLVTDRALHKGRFVPAPSPAGVRRMTCLVPSSGRPPIDVTTAFWQRSPKQH